MSTPRFRSLPIPTTDADTPRLTGVEIEFSGLDEVETADLVPRHLGGTIEDMGERSRIIRKSELGDIEVMLDTALRKAKGVPLLDKGLDLARGLVPVEIVSPPLTPDQIAVLDDLIIHLRRAGAKGTRDGMLLGFGVHLNPEIVAPDHPHTLRTIETFAYLEPLLRADGAIDATRRAMPFIQTWPLDFVTALAETPPGTLKALMHMAQGHITSRNHGLDLFPLFKHHAPDLMAKLFEDSAATSARPTFHFRLPDSRVDENDWSLSQAWDSWHLVETVATQDTVVQALRSAWLHHSTTWPGSAARWRDTVTDLLNANNLRQRA